MQRPRSLMLACLVALVAGALWLPIAHAEPSVYYFPATGHFLDDTYGFLSFWQNNNGAVVFGAPVAEAQVAGKLAFQYFEHGRLEQAVDPANGLTSVRAGRVGAEYAEALWKSFPAAPNQKLAQNERRFETTGYTLRAPFLSFWDAHGGEATFGAPISQAQWELTERGRRMVQYFEQARLERDPRQIGTDQEIVVGDLGRALANLRGIDTSRVANWGAPELGPHVATAANVVSLDVPTPAPLPPTAVPQPQVAQPLPKLAQPTAEQLAPQRTRASEPRRGKYIVVNLSDQWLYAYSDGDQVFSSPVSTGRDGMETPTGTYAIYDKIKLQTMDGVIDGKAWVVPNVPNVMYFNGGVALHGTYWHNRFGTGARLSHGCVNLPLKSAAWLYDWASVGTTVRVIY